MFTAQQARQLQTEGDLDARHLVINEFISNTWNNKTLDQDLVNILCDILLVAQTQCTREVRALTISKENLEQLSKLGYHFDWDEFSGIYTISF